MNKYAQYLYLTILFVHLTPIYLQAQPDKYIFDNYTIQHGLSQSTVLSMYQDKKGFLWFGTQDGLNRYDGYNFKIYRHDFRNSSNSLPQGLISYIHADENDNLLLCTQAGFSIFDTKYNKFHNFSTNPNAKNAISGNNILGLIIDNKNRFWIFHERGFSSIGFPLKNNYDSCIINNYDKVFGLTIHDAFETITRINKDKDGNYLCLRKQNLYVLDKNENDFNKLDFNNLPKSSYQLNSNFDKVLNISTDKNNNVWILYENRVDKLINTATKQVKSYFFKQNIQGSPYNFRVCSDSCLYFSNGKSGAISINLLTGETIVIANETENSKSILGGEIFNITEDNKGNIWFALNKGISKYSPGKYKFKFYYAKYGNKNWLQDDWPFAFGEDKYGKIWIGVNHGKGIYIFDKEKNNFELIPVAKKSDPQINPNDLFVIHRDYNNQMWIGTDGSGFGKYNEKTKSFDLITSELTDTTGLSSNHVYDIAEDKNHNLWLATRTGLTRYNLESKTFERIYLSGKIQNVILPENWYFSIHIATDSSIWLGTSGAGLQKLTFDKNLKPHFESFTQNPDDSTSISSNVILSIDEDRFGNLWISTFGGGLNVFNPKLKKFKHYTTANGLANNMVYGVLIDKDDRVWASTNSGLSMIDIKSGKIKNYTVNHGLQSNEFNQNAFFKDSEGYFYFGGVNGFNMFLPSTLQIDSSKSTPVFTDFKLFNQSVNAGINSVLKQSVSYTKTIELSYWQREFSFEFASDNYFAPTSTQYAYMIENYHPNWIFLGNNRSVSFTSFPHGKYVLKIRASNSDGIWSDVVTNVELIIHPPFWKTKWFTALMIGVLILLILAFIRFRTRKLRAEKLILELKVQERTSQIIAKNEELRQLNDEIMVQRDNLQDFNEELQVKNSEILYQKNEIEKKNKDITSSITYASRIQKALLPSVQILTDNFPESFVFWKPRDIVSGDFYFLRKVNNQLIIAAADCTGHGVPGAFMSTLGITLLNELSQNKQITGSHLLLDELRNQIKKALQQTGVSGEQQDGMDIAVCAINTDNLMVSYAGAHNPLWIFRKTETRNTVEFIKIQADRQPIGIYLNESPFTEHRLQLEKNDHLYIFSDGLSSQFGEKVNQKFKNERLKNFLESVYNKPFNEQHTLLNAELENWKGKTDQTDDILVIGIKI